MKLKLPLCLCILFLLSCEEISTPEKSGIGGLGGYTEPLPPLWRKKNGKILFYAESKTTDSFYIYDTDYQISQDISCICAVALPNVLETYACGCSGAEDNNCTCKKISVLIDNSLSGSGASSGIAFAEYAADCACAGTPEDNCACTGGEECTCPRKNYAQLRRVEFIVNVHERKFSLRWYASDAAVPEHELTDQPLPAVNLDKPNKLCIELYTISPPFPPLITYRFSINDTVLYPEDGDSLPYLFTLGNTYGSVFYLNSLAKSAPTRQNPCKTEFSTLTPKSYP
jgi:hypothetical protein